MVRRVCDAWLMDEVEMVRLYLKGQNLEQLGRLDEAISLYETAVAGGFDAIGPYDRLIVIYSGRAMHGDVVRVCDAALERVRTYEQKQTWYRQIRTDAEQAEGRVPRASPKNR